MNVYSPPPDFFRAVTIAATLLASTQMASAAFFVYISPPGQLTSNLAGVITEDFNGFSPTNTVWAPSPGGFLSTGLGTYLQTTGDSEVQSDDQYGSGTGDYMSIGVGGEVTLTLNDGGGEDSAKYFGFSWSAGDGKNQVAIQNDGIDIFTLSTQDIIDFLPNDASIVTAIDGSDYTTSDYYGKPGTGQNNSEEYAYIHILATDGDVFDVIKLAHLAGGRFENDNHSVLFTDIPVPEGDWVLAIPEPSTYAAFAGLLTLAFTVHSRRKQ